MTKNKKTNKFSIKGKSRKFKDKNKSREFKGSKPYFVKGQLIKYKRGFGFITQEKGDDVFIAARNMEGAMDGDNIEVKVKENKQKPGSFEGFVVNILSRKHTSIIGKLKRQNGLYIVDSIGKSKLESVYISGKNLKNARLGDIVLAKIIRYPKNGRMAEAKIKEIIAYGNDVDAFIKGITRDFGIDENFKSNIVDEADYASKRVRIRPNPKRKDLRSLCTVTIDGADSKDFDDAISVEKNDNGNFVLYVHIADVAEYVRMGTELDKEALKRGNSVYLPSKVIPMLPKKLSNGVCSLNPLEDRLAITCKMEIDDSGHVINYKILESVIKSNARLVYDDVSDILEKNDNYLRNKYESLHAMILHMKDLYEILNSRRMSDGSIDFDLPEAKVCLNDFGFPVKFDRVDRRIANRIIEEFMLIANKTVAEHFFLKKIPFVYRVHEKPELTKMIEFKDFISMWGLSINSNADTIKPKEFRNILAEIAGKPCEAIISRVMVRSMQKARYDTECLGHYGLAFKYYCHFTSPIRRYADLMVHRIIKNELHRGEFIEKSLDFKTYLEQTCEHISNTERKAMELERSATKYYETLYMNEHIDESFNGVVSGVKANGIYVELENSVEGFVDFNTLDDFYTVDERAYQAINNNNGSTISLGQKVKIIVADVNVEDGYIDFKFI